MEGMNLPTTWPLATILGEADGITVGLAIALAVVAIAWGEARVHISGLREWKREATAKLDALDRQAQDAKGRADLQGQQINHILQMLGEMRADLKTLLQRNVA